MIKLNTDRILIPVDFSETASLAIKHGAFMAGYLKGELILAHIIKTSVHLDILLPVLKLDDISVLTTAVEEKLENMAIEIRKEYGIKVNTVVSTGKVSFEIGKIAEEYNVGLIIMGTEGYSAIGEFLVGSNAYRVLSRSKIPVMTVRKEADKFGYRSIVLPIDSSEHSRQKVNATIDFASKFSAKLHILGVLGNEEKNFEPKMRVIIKQVEELAETQGLSHDSRIEFAQNRAHQTLKYAKSINADMVVTMTDQNAEMSGLVLGTYAHQLVNHSKIPIISFPPQINDENIPMSFAGLDF